MPGILAHQSFYVGQHMGGVECSLWGQTPGFSSGLCHRSLGQVILLSWARESCTEIALRVHSCSNADAVNTLLRSLFSPLHSEPYQVGNVLTTTSQMSW